MSNWKRILEAASTLDTLNQITPSERSSVSNTAGIGDRSEIGKTPESGQSKIWGNLNSQSRGFQGSLDTQGKKSPELFASHKGNTQPNDPGTFTPAKYKKMLNMSESAVGGETGTQSGKYKESAASGRHNPMNKHDGSDIRNGGSSNHNCRCKRCESVTESQLLGSTVALYASQVLSELLTTPKK